MATETISYLKKHANNLDLSEPMTITQNGKPAYVIETVQDRQRRDEAVALMKLLSFSVNDEADGKVRSSRSIKNKLATRKQKLVESANEQEANLND
ncbi:type II toxin-antitoxin system Phd/YefM family antitoxin [Vibrio mediterranei]|uniref:type II toxin-antitoxin system Phd/YefM family antitoxin n=1 Tax=Vibrio mediterranei TaxID=689 RepID=UPI001EFC4CC1|nr:type II toxin-antitoxin system Phd/YefM family antitoxin [Vibrio mediterranei]MCG9657628.1 type II toxin-antitoxin system Phd/YefM family antitoxin [Vibrio mediterranei]